MAKSYTIGFDNVELVDGLAPDKAVWLYMRATLLNDGDPEHPVWTDEVGSLPPDANRPAFDGFPYGDAGRYADGLVVAKPAYNKDDTNLPKFRVGPVEVGPGQTLEVMVIMLPMVWFETVSVPPETAERLEYGVFGALVGAVVGGGLPGAIVGFVAGLFGPKDEDVEVPCFNSVIMARNVFTAADLDQAESAGILRLGPQDNQSYIVCHQPIDAYYSLSVNPVGYSFAPTPQVNKELCTLEPRAYLAAEDQVTGGWGDVGNRISDCIQVLIDPRPPRHANVTIFQQQGSSYKVIGQFENIPITRGPPHPDFIRNFYDDGCPARAVKPDCPQCARFVNLPMMMMIVHPALLFLGMTPGSHIGSRPVFPIKTDTDNVTTARSVLHAQLTPRRVSKRDIATSRHLNAQEANLPAPFGQRHLVQRIDATHVRIWPAGTMPVRDQTFKLSFSDRLTTDPDIILPAELPLSWLLICSPEFTLASYQEIKGDGGCRKRLRYTRRDRNGVVVADVMLTPLLSAVN
jgi:hypothetical protein